MPNFEEYTQGFGLTEREFRLIKEQLEPGSRMFLIKQAHHSVVCQLDLKGFDGELAVISGRAARSSSACNGSSPSAERIPTTWLPHFLATRTLLSDSRSTHAGDLKLRSDCRF